MKFVVLAIILSALVFWGIYLSNNSEQDRTGSGNGSATGQHSRGGSGYGSHGGTKKVSGPKRLERKKLPPPTMEELKGVLLRLKRIKEETSDDEILKVTRVRFSDSDITNKELRVLSLLPNLKGLYLYDTQVSDLSPLSKCD